MRILVVGNIHIPLDHPSAGGMEHTANEFLLGLVATRISECDEIALIAHGETRVPAGVRLIPVRVPACAAEYQDEGFGVRRWDRTSSEVAIESLATLFPHFDIVHDHSSLSSVALIAHRLHIPCVRTVHLMPWHPVYAPVAHLVAKCVHISKFQAESDRWHPASQVIRPYVPVPNVASATKSSGAVSVGRVEPQKGHDTAVAVARELGVNLRVIGSYGDDSYTSRLAASPGVELVGELPRAAVLSEIQRASLLLWTPAIQEPFGRVILEALKLGTAVIGRPYGVLHDLRLAGAKMENASTQCGISPSHGDLLFANSIVEGWEEPPDSTATRHWRLYADLVSAL